MWIARDDDGRLALFRDKPEWDDEEGRFVDAEDTGVAFSGDDEFEWLCDGLSIPARQCAQVRIVLADKPLPLFAK